MERPVSFRAPLERPPVLEDSGFVGHAAPVCPCMCVPKLRAQCVRSARETPVRYACLVEFSHEFEEATRTLKRERVTL